MVIFFATQPTPDGEGVWSQNSASGVRLTNHWAFNVNQRDVFQELRKYLTYNPPPSVNHMTWEILVCLQRHRLRGGVTVLLFLHSSFLLPPLLHPFPWSSFGSPLSISALTDL